LKQNIKKRRKKPNLIARLNAVTYGCVRNTKGGIVTDKRFVNAASFLCKKPKETQKFSLSRG
jgi:hypothetical protein